MISLLVIYACRYSEHATNAFNLRAETSPAHHEKQLNLTTFKNKIFHNPIKH